MSILSFLYRNGLWIAVPVFLICSALLGFFILRVIRVVRQAHILGVPLLGEQVVEFAEAGLVVLCIEGPRFTTRFARLSYGLIAPDGSPIKGRRSWFHAVTSGVSKARMELRYYEIPQPGHYVLQIKGLKASDEPDSKHRIVFMRPHLARSIVCVIGIVLAGLLLIGSVVLFFIRLTSQGNAS